MKKTILIVLFLLTFASTAFSKVQVPEDERWIYITGNKKQEDTWMDMYTMEFGRSLKSDYHHKEPWVNSRKFVGRKRNWKILKQL